MKKLTRRKFIKTGIAATVGFVLLDSLWFEKYFIEWNYFDLSKSESNKIKIIQISDLHLDQLRSFHQSIADKINSVQPDLVLITGDSVDQSEKLEQLNSFLQLQGSGRYLKGWYRDAEPPMYISKGIGTSVLPIRFGARAEIVELEI